MAKQTIIALFDSGNACPLSELYYQGFSDVPDSLICGCEYSTVMVSRYVPWWNVFAWRGARVKDYRGLRPPVDPEAIISAMTEESPILAEMPMKEA